MESSESGAQGRNGSRANSGAELFDFVDEYLRDCERGTPQTLAHYLARFPGFEEDVAREYLALRVEPSASDSDASNARTDERRIGPYRLIAELGRGGQGTVWLAEDTRIARRVALKLLPPSFGALSTDRRRRLQREAEVISRLAHPSICSIYEAQIEGDLPYIAMRHVEGETLATAIARARQSGSTKSAHIELPPRSALAVRELLHLFERAARALHAAHEAGVVHRDVKPANIMVTHDGEPVILDFGVARDEQSTDSVLTLEGELFGTPAYMSPEQVLGHAHDVDRRCDVWSLGGSLYEALTLRQPFTGASVPELLIAIQGRSPPNARELNAAVPQELAVVLETALEKDVERRYPTALELAEDLRRIREYEAIRARPPSAWLLFRRWVQRHPVLAALSASVVLALSVGLVGALYLLRRADDALTVALGRHLAQRAQSLLGDDPSASLALAIEAVQREPSNYETRATLFSALDACYLKREFDGTPARRFLDLQADKSGRRVAATLADGTARVYEVDTGRELVRTGGSTWQAHCVRIDPAGERLFAACDDGRVRVFDASTAAALFEFDGPGGVPSSLELSELGDRMVIAAAEGVTVYDTQRGERIAGLELPRSDAKPRWPLRALLSPDGRLVLTHAEPPPGAPPATAYDAAPATASDAALWTADDGRMRCELRGHAAPITWAEFRSDGALVATASRDATVRLWRTDTGTLDSAPLREVGPVTCARFSPDGRQLATGVEHGTPSHAWLWSLESGAHTPLSGHDQRSVVHVAFSPDGAQLATASSDLTVRTWCTADARPLTVYKGYLPTLRALWSGDGRTLVTLSSNLYAQVWYACNRPDIYALTGHASAVNWASFSPDGERAITASDDGTARVWSTPSVANARCEPGRQLFVLEGHAARVSRAAFSPDGALALTLSDDGTARLWNAHSGEPSGAPLVHGAALADGRFSSNGQTLATLTADGVLRAFDLAHARAERVLTCESPAQCLAFSHDGAFLYSAHLDDRVLTWRVATGELCHENRWTPDESFPHGAVDLAVRGDDGELAVACSDSRVRFFKPLSSDRGRDLIVFPPRTVAYNRDASRLLVTGTQGIGAIRLQDLEASASVRGGQVYHSADLTGGVFDAGGNYVLTIAKDGGAYVRKASDGSPFAHVGGHGQALLCGEFSPGAGVLRVITACADGTAHIWPVDPLPPAIARKPRELNEYERDRERRLALPLVYR